MKQAQGSSSPNEAAAVLIHFKSEVRISRFVSLALLASAGISFFAPANSFASMKHFSNPQSRVAHKRHGARKSTRRKKRGSVSAEDSSLTAPRGHQLTPQEFVDQRVQKVLADLGARPLRGATVLTRADVDTSSNRQQFISSLYNRGLVDASWSSEMMADKLIMARLLDRELGARAKIYYPKTVGLREFLVRKNLLDKDGSVIRNGDQIEAALHDEFPMGYVVRPAVGVAPQETLRGIYPDMDQFIVTLLKPGSPLYNPQHLRQPVVSHILNDVASGEAVVIQESIIGSADAHRPLKQRSLRDIRVHTFEGRVVANSVPDRWAKGGPKISEADARLAQDFVADFLKSLPMSMVNRQAWAVDVGLADNGEMRVMDIVTNCGNPTTWSGSLDQPKILGAYARHFESYYGLRFAGMSGTLLRHNFGNYVSYWSKRIDHAKPGMDRMLAYLPPMP